MTPFPGNKDTRQGHGYQGPYGYAEQHDAQCTIVELIDFLDSWDPGDPVGVEEAINTKEDINS